MSSSFAIVIHGGAEDKTRENIGPEQEIGYQQGLATALEAGWTVLNNGGTAVEAVEAAVRSLEDNPLFNAGRGGALTIDGKHEFDAAIMDGNTLQAGAVAGVKRVKNPISLARAIMERSEHVMLSGEGAKTFAQQENLEIISNEDYFTVPEKVEDLQKQKQQSAERGTKDTVGAVALDKMATWRQLLLRTALPASSWAGLAIAL